MLLHSKERNNFQKRDMARLWFRGANEALRFKMWQVIRIRMNRKTQEPQTNWIEVPNHKGFVSAINSQYPASFTCTALQSKASQEGKSSLIDFISTRGRTDRKRVHSLSSSMPPDIIDRTHSLSTIFCCNQI